MFSIRTATQQDAFSIAHVHVHSWRTTYTGIVPQTFLDNLDETERAASWREWLTLDVEVFVAEWDGGIVGFAAGGPIREPVQDHDAELYAIYLLQDAQGRGIGTALLKTLAQSLHAKGFSSMAAWVLESNASSRFYARTGARQVASKEIEIGGAMLPIVAYGWPWLKALVQAP